MIKEMDCGSEAAMTKDLTLTLSLVRRGD